MGRKFIGLLFIFVFAGARLVSTAQQPAPGASSYLAGTAESFLASCRSDVEDGKKRIAALKASSPPRDAMATLQAFDTALVVVVDAENRAGLAEQVHPSKPFRDVAQTCEQEVSRVLTDISLDKDMYKVLASLDGSGFLARQVSRAEAVLTVAPLSPGAPGKVCPQPLCKFVHVVGLGPVVDRLRTALQRRWWRRGFGLRPASRQL